MLESTSRQAEKGGRRAAPLAASEPAADSHMTLPRTIKRREQRKRAKHRPKPRPLTPGELAMVKRATELFAHSVNMARLINREYDSDRAFLAGAQWGDTTRLRTPKH